MEELVEIEDIELAYRKLKHVVYWDTTYSFLRGQIADFEAKENLKDVFKSIRLAINTQERSFFTDYIEDVDYFQLPKATPTNYKEEDGVITNITDTEKIVVKRDFKFINVDIRLHIISVLWILQGGFKLEKDMVVKPHGNRLRFSNEKNEILEGLPLFYPYAKLYKKWRDNAFIKAREVVAEKKNVLILSLDVMNYYPSVRLNIEALKEALQEKGYKVILNFLTDVLEELHKDYAMKININRRRLKTNTPNESNSRFSEYGFCFGFKIF